MNRDYPELEIHLLAVNEDGHSSSNDKVVEEGNLPLLQDDATAQVWENWNATWRDVHVVDAENMRVDVFNLTGTSLGETDNYETLKGMLLDAASE